MEIEEMNSIGFFLYKELFKRVLPETNIWSVEYSSNGSYFDCRTAVTVENSIGVLSLYMRFEITNDLELVVSKIGSSRKNSSLSWSGTKYGEFRNAALERDVKAWVLALNAKGVRVLDGAY